MSETNYDLGGQALAQSEVREVLQYVPLFVGKVFLVAISGHKMSDTVLAETLLDLMSLQRIGVKLVVVFSGANAGAFLDRAVELEVKISESSPADCPQVLSRGQAALVTIEEGGQFNEELVSLSLSVKADKLLYLGKTEDYPSAWQGALALQEALEVLPTREQGQVSELALAAVRNGVNRVHLLDALMPGCLSRELFSNEGVGVMIYLDSYQEIRPLSEEDIPELLAIIGHSMRAQHLLPRSYEAVIAQIGDYYVMSIDENVVGSVAIHGYEGGVCELACLFVKDIHKGLGYGHDLVKFAEEKAQSLGFTKIFALSTDAGGFFEKQMGYKEMPLDVLPSQRYEKLMRTGRNSIALVKALL